MIEPLHFYIVISFCIVLLAVVIDIVLGDPSWFPHPVRIMGYAIDRGEKLFRRLPVEERVQGGLLAGLLVALTWFLTTTLLSATVRFGLIPWFFLSVVLLYFCFSLRCLADEARKVLDVLLGEGLCAARERVSWLVSRDVSYLDEAGVMRSLIETVAENSVDGVISPYFYALILGPAGAMTFKMISTMDSMIGYLNDKYERFGYVAAKLDDAANFIPARIGAMLIAISSGILGLNSPAKVLKAVKDEGRLHDSPNSGFAEAAFAAALGVRLSGPAVYHGCLLDRPYLNSNGVEPCARHVEDAIKLLYMSSILGLLLMIIVVYVCFTILGYFCLIGWGLDNFLKG